jgi:ABC-type transport system involved in multi-copper enzyme maturation permease subunit
MTALFVLAQSTWRQFVRDRVFYLAFFVAALLVAFSYLLATLTIVESRKILLDFGFAALSLAGVCIAIYLGIAAIAREIENRTIYTIVSKPVSRRAYLLGKFIGSAAVLAVTQLLLSAALAMILKMAGEDLPPGFAQCCGLIFLENLIVLSFAILVSIPFSSVMAGALSIAFFLVGRSSVSIDMMAQKAESAEVKVFAGVLYYVFPNLERFNLRDVVAYGQPFPAEMIPLALSYAAAYTAVCLVAAILVLGRRDLP